MKKLTFFICSLFYLGMAIGNAQLTDLLSFSGANGQSPNASLTLSGKVLYGMTPNGGSGSGCIFSIDTNGGGYRNLHNFVVASGGVPMGSLTLYGNKLYGMTFGGGAHGEGVVFSIDTDGNGYKDIFDFDGATGDNPYGSLAISGTQLFGMTREGGAHDSGIVFSVDTTGHNFKDLLDFTRLKGYLPYNSLTIAGNVLYGMTSGGGTSNDGVVFSIDTNGSGYTNIFNFNYTNGGGPMGNLTISGNTLYGMASEGGANTDGDIFSIHTNGSGFRDMYDLSYGKGYGPGYNSLLLIGSQLYGVTLSGGGIHGWGCIFSIDTNGSGFKDLYVFNDTTGAAPTGCLVHSGNFFYGMTQSSGAFDTGTVFRFKDTAVTITTSVNTLTNNCKLNVYPNPSNGQFTIQSSVVSCQWSVEIYKVLGEKVYSQFNNQQTTFTIDLSNKPSGVYLYRVIESNGELIGEGKLIIQK